jgi:Fe-S cluster assembly ATP-binding protein
MLEIKNLRVSIKNNQILNGVTFSMKKGEIHAIMGINGSGKSTFSKVLAGHPSYEINSGEIIFEDENINLKSPEERAKLGLFLAFQYPVEIPGVTNEEFLRVAYNLKRKNKNLKDVSPIEFLNELKIKLNLSNLNYNFLKRNINEGFSGGEKKKNEILQMNLLDPKLAILDETDSGLDIDALKSLSSSINKFMNKEKGLILITHYPRLLDYIKPNYVHIMFHGKILLTGDASLAYKLETRGYEWLID